MFNDVSSYNKIMGATSSLDCKNAARTIKNFDRECWEKTAETLCKAGIRAKFSQNQYLLEVLTEKQATKRWLNVQITACGQMEYPCIVIHVWTDNDGLVKVYLASYWKK